MATATPNLGLLMPDRSDRYEDFIRNVFGLNMDKIDEVMKSISDVLSNSGVLKNFESGYLDYSGKIFADDTRVFLSDKNPIRVDEGKFIKSLSVNDVQTQGDTERNLRATILLQNHYGFAATVYASSYKFVELTNGYSEIPVSGNMDFYTSLSDGRMRINPKLLLSNIASINISDSSNQTLTPQDIVSCRYSIETFDFALDETTTIYSSDLTTDLLPYGRWNYTFKVRSREPFTITLPSSLDDETLYGGMALVDIELSDDTQLSYADIDSMSIIYTIYSGEKPETLTMSIGGFTSYFNEFDGKHWQILAFINGLANNKMDFLITLNTNNYDIEMKPEDFRQIKIHFIGFPKNP